MSDERGALVREFPQTFTTKNWPFFVFLAVLGGALAAFAYFAGSPLAAAALFAGALVVPVPFYVGKKLFELWGAAPLALYERGLHVRWRGGTQFIAWSDVAELRSWFVEEDGFTNTTVTVVQLKTRAGISLTVSGPAGEDVRRLAEAGSGLATINEGLRRWA